MATKTRGRGVRPAGRRSKRTVRGRVAKGRKARSSSSRGAKRRAVARKKSVSRVRKTSAAAGAKRAKRRTAPSAKASGGTSRELAALKREKTQLEKRLTDTVREIGQLRYHEARASQLERQLAERDQTIGQLRSEIAELRNRRPEPSRDAEVQRSLALGSGPPRDLDEFDDDLGPDDEDDELI